MQRRLTIALWLALIALLYSARPGFAHAGNAPEGPWPVEAAAIDGPPSVTTFNAACSGGPTIDGILLDECVDRAFSIASDNYTIRVYYTKVQTNASRDDGSGGTLTLQHWINQDSEAAQVAAWTENAWRRYRADSGHNPYITGCSNRLTIQMEDGVGWSGIAYWASSGNCVIGIDSPMVRNGGGERTVYHEVQHYLQYSYNDGCYANLQANYDGGSDAGNAEFTEGYADLGSDTVNATVDAQTYAGVGYDPERSMYTKNYRNIFNKYFIEQLGTLGAPSDPQHHIDAMYAHYSQCDLADNLYVLDTLIPSLSGGKWNIRQFFMNFFAANWARAWADQTNQPELTYWDDDQADFGNLAPLRQNVTLPSGTQSWTESTPDTWAARYYQIQPSGSCKYVQLEVDGQAGASLGINLMAAKTSSPTTVLRSAKIGEDFVRAFAGAGVHDRLVVAVNSFQNNYSYTVRATCVNPVINILEPRQVKYALVGAPDSPIAFLARWEVLDGTANVRGLTASSFSFSAGSDAVTVVPNTFQEVGDEYWATLLPPVKPAGTTFVNFGACLDAICDSETNALLYVNPGNSDTALVFDASGSMNSEDATGEGTRLFNAKRAGKVVADLLRPGDRILVTDFSAKNNPVNCGIPSGAGNCEFDIRLLLPRSDITAGNVATLVNSANTAINNITAREWTPVSEALADAKNKLLAVPTNTNPKYIYLLSDGEENVKRLYPELKGELVGSGVVMNTIGFGPEAPGNLLAQIAADTGGIYRPVSTNGVGSGLMAASVDSNDAVAALAALNVPAEMQQALAAPYLPGQLGLANVYDYFDTEAQDAARVIHLPYTGVPEYPAANSQKEAAINVDKSVNQLRVVVAGKQEDIESCTVSNVRKVEVLPPTADPQKRYYPISPRNSLTPAEWEIRNNTYDDVLIVNNPEPGTWRIRVYYFRQVCIPLQAADANDANDANRVAEPDAVSEGGGPYDFFINVSVQSIIQFEGRILGLTDNQGTAGDEVTLIGALLDRSGLVTPTLMAVAIEGPAGDKNLFMFDDGLHNDGSAGDLIFGNRFAQTTLGGGYSVRMLVFFADPANPAQGLLREWNGGFWIKGPKANDKDDDGLPDDWERRCKLNLQGNDAKEDPDRDGLTNLEEFEAGTLPCRADTDNGGEKDGSEVRNGRNPLEPKDDKVRILDVIKVRPLNGRLLIQWSNAQAYSRTLLYVGVTPDLNVRPVDIGQKGEYLVEGLKNDQKYYVKLIGVGENNAEGDDSQLFEVTPKSDPDIPAGMILIEKNADGTVSSTSVKLRVDSTDVPLPGMAQGANAHMTDQLSLIYNTVSGGVQVHYSNDPSMAGAQYEPFSTPKSWTLACQPGQLCTVYAQFKDAAGNESFIVSDSAVLKAPQTGVVYLPWINR
jgi:hypothetical protein